MVGNTLLASSHQLSQLCPTPISCSTLAYLLVEDGERLRKRGSHHTVQTLFSIEPKCCCVINTIQWQPGSTEAVLCTPVCAGVLLPSPQGSKGTIKFIIQNYFIPVRFYLRRFIYVLSHKSPEMTKLNGNYNDHWPSKNMNIFSCRNWQFTKMIFSQIFLIETWVQAEKHHQTGWSHQPQL